jgi:hypothetical protein
VIAPSVQAIVLLLLIPLLVWRVYARFRRLVGRQRLTKVRPWVALTLFPLLIGLLAWLVYPNVDKIGWLGAGLAGGGGLAVLGLKLTSFERTPQGLFYTPSGILGVSLVLLFVGRIAYRAIEVYALSASNTLTGFVVSSVTLAVFGLLAGYYIGYALGLLRWRYKI